jgi:hypothetical protein
VKKAAAACILVLAAGAAVIAWPQAAVERWYSTGAYAIFQRPLTELSNLVPFALADILIVVVIAAWLVPAIADVSRSRRQGAWLTLRRIVSRSLVFAAAIYLAFLLLWGLNYQRVPLERKVAFDARALTPAAARSAAAAAVSRVNALYGRAHSTGFPASGEIDASLAAAFAGVVRDLGGSERTVPGRPKHTLLNWYFRPAAVDGATDPFFLETLIASELLPVERPFIVAHEWSHLAGFADEGEANFAGWLTCTRASPPVQYSGWLFLYSEAVRSLPRRDREAMAAALAAGPRDDLRAVAARVAQGVRPQVAAAGWRVYDRYLKANRIEAGAASYAQVIRLVLGTELGRHATAD